MRVTGMKSHKARLNRIRGAAMTREVGKAITVAADLIKVGAQISITEGAVSGRNHVPSAPGLPPNADTHHLSNSITAQRTGLTTAEVSSNAEYSAPLEFGTSRMAARPFMQPAADKNRKKATALVMGAVKRVAKGETL